MKQEHKYFYFFLATWSLLLLASLKFEYRYLNHWTKLREGKFSFKKNQKVTLPRRGDLSHNIGSEHFKQGESSQITFTTDQYGFRNPSYKMLPRYIVLGDSYVTGIGLTDENTLTAQMSQLLNEPVYNYSGKGLLAPSMYATDKRFRAIRPKVVVWAPVMSLSTHIFNETWQDKPQSLYKRLTYASEKIQAQKTYLEESNSFTRLVKKVGFQIFNRYNINRFFSSDKRIIRVEGQDKLTLSLESQSLYKQMSKDYIKNMVVDSIVSYAHKLKRSGIEFIYAPIPTPGIIYQDYYSKKDKEKRHCSLGIPLMPPHSVS